MLAAVLLERTNGVNGQIFPIYQIPTTPKWLHSSPMQPTDPDMKWPYPPECSSLPPQLCGYQQMPSLLQLSRNALKRDCHTLSIRLPSLSKLVFKGPVWSSLWVPEGVDRDRDWSTFVLELQKTGLDCRRPKTAVFCGLWTGLGLNWS